MHLLESDRELSAPRFHTLQRAIEQLKGCVFVTWVDLLRHEFALCVDKELVLAAALKAHGLEHTGGGKHHLKVAIAEGATVQGQLEDCLGQAARRQAIEEDHASLNVYTEEVRLRPLRDRLITHR